MNNKKPLILKTQNICKKFLVGKNMVNTLKNVNIHILQKNFTVLRGRSGSGKTTLINILGVLDLPTKGFVFYRDNEITGLSQAQKDYLHRNDFAFVFQSVGLISALSACENVEFALRIAQFDRKMIEKRAAECLKMVGLSKRMHHRPCQLSGGEQQRVAIARAISNRSSIIFADEPTAELDTVNGLQIIHIFKELIKAEEITVVMTSHDQNIIDLADSVFTLQDGEVIDGN